MSWIDKICHMCGRILIYTTRYIFHFNNSTIFVSSLLHFFAQTKRHFKRNIMEISRKVFCQSAPYLSGVFCQHWSGPPWLFHGPKCLGQSCERNSEWITIFGLRWSLQFSEKNSQCWERQFYHRLFYAVDIELAVSTVFYHNLHSINHDPRTVKIMAVGQSRADPGRRKKQVYFQVMSSRAYMSSGVDSVDNVDPRTNILPMTFSTF